MLLTWTLAAITYNCQWMKSRSRVEEIARTLDATIIGLQSTCMTLKKRDDQEVTQRTVGKFHCIDFRTDLKGYTNNSCGCSILTQFSDKTIHKIFEVASGLIGRLGAVRYRCNSYDLCPIVAYFPCEDGKASTKTCIENMCQWLAEVLNKLPIRCTPLILTDLNGKLGRQEHNTPLEEGGRPAGCGK